MFLLLILHMFHTFSNVSIVDFEQINVNHLFEIIHIHTSADVINLDQNC